MTDVYAPYRARLAELIAKRDALNAEVAPLVKEQQEAASRSAELNQRANELAKQIQAVRGGQSWLDLKKEIGALSHLLSGKKA